MQGSIAVMMKLKEMGIVLKFRSGMHEKIALIDNKIKWFGYINYKRTIKIYLFKIVELPNIGSLTLLLDLQKFICNYN